MTMETLPAQRPPHPPSAARVAGPGEWRPRELVLLRGQPGSAADWQGVARRLPARLRRIAAGRPGYGDSPQPAADFTANARAVLDLLDSRGIQRAVLVGHSYRGGVVLAAASLALVLIRAARQLAQVLPDTRLQLVQGAGHHLPRRAPDADADAIAAFLAATDSIASRH